MFLHVSYFFFMVLPPPPSAFLALLVLGIKKKKEYRSPLAKLSEANDSLMTHVANAKVSFFESFYLSSYLSFFLSSFLSFFLSFFLSVCLSFFLHLSIDRSIYVYTLSHLISSCFILYIVLSIYLDNMMPSMTTYYPPYYWLHCYDHYQIE